MHEQNKIIYGVLLVGSKKKTIYKERIEINIFSDSHVVKQLTKVKEDNVASCCFALMGRWPNVCDPQ